MPKIINLQADPDPFKYQKYMNISVYTYISTNIYVNDISV